VGSIELDKVTAALATPSKPPDADWRLSIDIRDGVELEVPLLELLEILEPVAEQLAELRHHGAECDFF
jgi:hypothetical protein